MKCRKCGREFAVKATIDGKSRNLCNRKYCLKCSPFGKHNTKDLCVSELIDSTAKAVISVCKKHGKTEFVRENSGRYRCKKCRVEAVVEHRQTKKLKLIEYKGGECCRCHYNKPIPGAYEFHHSDPSQKDFGISAKSTRSFERLKKEVDKCMLVCRNCHAEIHYELYRAG